MKKILILGATGNTGKLVAALLLNKTDCRILLGARNEARLIELSDDLGKIYPIERIGYLVVDAGDKESLQRAFEGIDLVVVCSPSLDVYRNIIDKAIASGIDYFDINISAGKNEYLRSKRDEIIAKGLCFVTDGGFHPGVPAAMVNFASSKFDEITKANVFGLLRMNWGDYYFSKETVLEMVDEMRDYSTSVFKHGKWTKPKYSEYPKTSFPPPFGTVACYPMHLDEMLELPEKHLSLRETGFYVSGFNTFVDNLILPPAYIILKLFGRLALKPVAFVFQWALKKYSKPPFSIMLKLESEGLINGVKKNFEITLTQQDGYEMTAIPMIAFLLQYIDDSIRKPGLFYQATIVEPKRFFSYINSMGVEINTELI